MQTDSIQYLSELEKNNQNAARESRKAKLIATGIFEEAKLARRVHEKEFLPAVRETQPYFKEVGKSVRNGLIRRTFGDTIGNEIKNAIEEVELLLEKTRQVPAALDELANRDPYEPFPDPYERDRWCMKMRDHMGNHCGAARLLTLKQFIEDQLKEGIRARGYSIRMGFIKADDLPVELSAIVRGTASKAEPEVDSQIDLR